MPYWILGELYAETGRYDEAIASLKEAQSHGGRAQQISTTVAGIYARMAKPQQARRMLAELKATTDPPDSQILRQHLLTPLSATRMKPSKCFSAWSKSGTTWRSF
jgi:hypothetical protein